MPIERFDVVFYGKIQKGQNQAAVQARISKLFNNASAATIAKMFSGHPVVLRKQVTLEAANNFCASLRRVGAISEIQPSQGLEIKSTAVAPPGVQIDLTPLPPPANIDTSNLDLISGTEWGLQDCAAPEPEASTVAPDLDLNVVGTNLDVAPEPKQIAIDTSNLDLVSGSSWELQDCAAPDPVVKISTHGLTLNATGVALDTSPDPARPSINTKGIVLENLE